MAVYKVPQDVEADDKLIGPFSFRQFIYLIVVAICMAGAWGLSQIFIPLAVIPLPIMVFFAALALPLRKDQPMEAYLSAVVSFYFLKSRKRFWISDGIDSFVTIIPPKDADRVLTKDLDESEATKRLGYLADLVDTHGWAIRGAGGTPDTSINTDLYYESQQTTDMMDSSTPAARAMIQHLQKEAAGHRKDAIDTMKEAKKAGPDPAAVTKANVPTPSSQKQPAATSEPTRQVERSVADDTPLVSNLPSVEEVRAKSASDAANKQRTIEARDALTFANGLLEETSEDRGIPIATPTPENVVNTSASTPDTGTIELTQKQADELLDQKPETKNDVSVATLGQEANRVAQKNKVLKDGDEVTISFH